VPEPVTAPALKCSTSKALSGRSVTNLFLGGHNELYAPGSLGTFLQFIHVRWQTLWGGQVANRFTNLFQELLQRSCRRLDEEEFAHLRSHVRVGVHRCPGNIDHRRYCQMLWIGFSSHAATFSSIPSSSFPFLNFAPALTNATR